MSMLEKRLSVKLGATFLLTPIITAVSGGLIFKYLDDSVKNSVIANHSYEVTNAVGLIREASLSRQTGLIGYIFPVSKDALTPFTQGLAPPR